MQNSCNFIFLMYMGKLFFFFFFEHEKYNTFAMRGESKALVEIIISITNMLMLFFLLLNLS
jgi:hypothetical protein